MRLREVADRIGGWVAPENENQEIHGVAPLSDANPGDLSFYGNPKYLSALRKSHASAVLVPHGFGEEVSAVRIWVDNPAGAFSTLLPVFVPPPVSFPPSIHPTAVIGESVRMGEHVHVGAYAVIEDGATIGNGSIVGAHVYIGHSSSIGANCHIYPHVSIRERCSLGNRVVIHSGAVIGADGFGYEFRDGAQQKIPQTGTVQIDDDVEIGANSTIDRARFGRTWIQRGTKIDNLVQIGHNVSVGEHCVLCAQVGISGSTRIGNNVTMAGKVGIGGHIEIGDGVICAATAALSKSVPPGSVMFGIPARPLNEFKRTYPLIKNIQKLYDRVKSLEADVLKREGEIS